MSKRIVFLYCTQKNKEDLFRCESVMRALLRKFRKSALFSYVQLDASLPCRSQMSERLLSETERADAVFLECDEQNISSSMDLLKDVFGIYATSQHISGRAICYPEKKKSVQNCEESLINTEVYAKENIKRASLIALKLAKAQRRSLSICLQPLNELDSLFLREAEYSLCREKHISSEHISLNAMIALCVKTIPSFDVVLTLGEYAPIIAMHLNSLPEIPVGFIVSYAEKLKIFRRQILPCDEINNLHLFSSVISIASIFENELEMKSAGAWLKRAVSLAFEKGASDTPDGFIKEITDEINSPIRKRKA